MKKINDDMPLSGVGAFFKARSLSIRKHNDDRLLTTQLSMAEMCNPNGMKYPADQFLTKERTGVRDEGRTNPKLKMENPGAPLSLSLRLNFKKSPLNNQKKEADHGN